MKIVLNKIKAYFKDFFSIENGYAKLESNTNWKFF